MLTPTPTPTPATGALPDHARESTAQHTNPSAAPASSRAATEPLRPLQSLDPLEPNLPTIGALAGIARDLESAGVSLRGHPVSCLRPWLARTRTLPCAWLRDDRRTPAGRVISVAGIVLVRQRPSTAKGIVFVTIEDETGTANLIFRPRVYERLRVQVRGAVVLRVRGKVERRDGVVHVLVAHAEDLAEALESAGRAPGPTKGGGAVAIASQSRDFR